MNLLLKRILGASFAFAAFSFVNPTPANAQSCAVAPTCESLGYTLTEADCEGHNFLKCPFDTSVGYCDSGSGSSIKCENPSLGNFLYSDMSCSSSLYADKTVIGIIISPEYRIAVALDSEEKKWSEEYFDIPDLKNEIYASGPTGGWDGKTSTKIIIDYCQANGKSCPAAEYAYNYTTEGTKAGDWFLPYNMELFTMMDNYELISTQINLVGKNKMALGYYWSSAEYNDSDAWGRDYNKRTRRIKKDGAYHVRPMLQF